MKEIKINYVTTKSPGVDHHHFAVVGYEFKNINCDNEYAFFNALESKLSNLSGKFKKIEETIDYFKKLAKRDYSICLNFNSI